MLAEIDKDARDIAALQHENKILTSQVLGLERKVSELDQVTKDFEVLKSEMLQMQKYIRRLNSFDEAPILLNAETMEEVVLKPFVEIKGRRLYHAPVDEDGGTRYIAGRNLRVIKVCGSNYYANLDPPDIHLTVDYYHFTCCQNYKRQAYGLCQFTCHDILIDAFFKQKYAEMYGIIEIQLFKYTCHTSSPVNYCPEPSSCRKFTFHPTTYTENDKKQIFFFVFLIEVL